MMITTSSPSRKPKNLVATTMEAPQSVCLPNRMLAIELGGDCVDDIQCGDDDAFCNEDGRCTLDCSNDENVCPDDFVCYDYEDPRGSECVDPAFVGNTALGDPCRNNVDCTSGLCFEDPYNGNMYCSKSCTEIDEACGTDGDMVCHDYDLDDGPLCIKGFAETPSFWNCRSLRGLQSPTNACWALVRKPAPKIPIAPATRSSSRFRATSAIPAITVRIATTETCASPILRDLEPSVDAGAFRTILRAVPKVPSARTSPEPAFPKVRNTSVLPVSLSCTVPTTCLDSGYCERPELVVGDPCNEDGECISGICQDGYCSESCTEEEGCGLRHARLHRRKLWNFPAGRHGGRNNRTVWMGECPAGHAR